MPPQSRVHVDYQILFDRDLLISLVNPLLDPVCEVITSNGVCNVDYPLLRELWSFLLFGEKSLDFGILAEEVADIGEEQPLVSMKKYWMSTHQLLYLLGYF